MSNNQIKFKTCQEGCGKWLTAKSNTNPKRLNRKSTASKPNNSSVSKKLSSWPKMSPVAQKIPTKQSKMNTFLVNTTEKCGRSKSFGNLTHSNLTVKITGPTSSGKRHSSQPLDEYVELWGSEDESEDEIKENHKEKLTTKILSQRMAKEPKCTVTSLTTKYNVSLETSSNKYGDGLSNENEEALHLSKKVKTSNEYENNLCKSEAKKNDLFTQWLQDQVDEFCRDPCDKKKTNLINKILLAVRPSQNRSPITEIQNTRSSEESAFLGQFSEWLNQHVETVHINNDDQKLLPDEICQQGFEFSQWFDQTLETFLKNPDENTE